MAGMSCLPLNAINPASSRRPGRRREDLGNRRQGEPKHYRAAESELKAQRTVTRRKNKRSNRRRKAINILARKHLHIKRQRADFHHKTAQMIDVTITSPSKNVAGWRIHLAKSISDAGWNQFARILTTKCKVIWNH